MAGNFIAVYRKLLDDPIFIQSTGAQVKVLLALLCMATWKEKTWDVNGKKITLKPGQIFISDRDLALKCGKDVSHQNVKTALKRFENLEFLTQESTRWGRLITIVNWAKYQRTEDDLTQPLTQSSLNPNSILAQPSLNPNSPIKEQGNNVTKKQGNKDKKDTTATAVDVVKKFCEGRSPELQEALMAWLDSRKKRRNYPTAHAVDLNLRKLVEFSEDKESAMVDIVNYSVEGGYPSFYAPKKETNHFGAFRKVQPQKSVTDWSDVTGW